MEKKQPDAGAPAAAVGNRWWAELGKERREPAVRKAPVGSRFYRAGQGFEQDKARDRLTDNNLKILRQTNPPQGSWAYLPLADRVIAEPQREKIRQSIAVPSYARAVLVDCGKYARVLVTGTPIGERVLELTLGGAPSFDCWVHDDWVCEEVYRSTDEAIKKFRRRVEQYLSPQAIERADSIKARA